MPIIEYGGLYIPTTKVRFTKQQQEPPARGDGNTARNNRIGTRQFVINSLEGGLGRHKGTVNLHATRFSNSDGLWTHQPGELTLPPAVTNQSTLTSVNASNYFTSGINPVFATSNVGSSSGPVTYMGVGPRLYRVHQTTGVVSLAHTFTNNITWLGDVYANSTLYFAAITDGTTDDARVTTNPTAGTITWSLWFALSSGDRIDFAVSMPNVGGFGVTYLQGILGTEQGSFYLSQASPLATAPSIAVDTDTRTEEGDITIANTGTTSPSTGWHIAGTGDTARINVLHSRVSASGVEADGDPFTVIAEAQAVDSRWTIWSTATNVSASDDSYASASFVHAHDSDSESFSGINASTEVVGGVAVLTDILVGSFDLSSIPNASIITGLVVEVEAAEGNLNDDITFWRVQIVKGGDLHGENRATGQEVTDTDAYYTFGSSIDRWGTDLKGTDVNKGQLGIGVQFRSNSNDHVVTDSGSVRVDHIRITVYYRELGIHANVPTGCKLIGRDPLFSNRIWYIRPVSNDATGRTISRSLFFVNVDFDPDQERLTVTHVPKQIPRLDYVQAACFSIDSMYVAMSNDSGFGFALLTFDLNSLFVKDVIWSREQGFTDDWSIINLYQWGEDLIIQCSNGDELQDMFYDKGGDSFHFIGPKVDTNGSYMTWFSGGAVDSASGFRFTFYAVSSTHLAVFRQFTPDSPNLDPIYSLSSIVKQDGPLVVVLPEFGDLLGAEESDKMLLTAWCFGDNISATNTVRLRYSIDGGDTFNTWGTFTDSEQKIALSTPVAFRTLVIEIALDHSAGTADTPNPLPIIIEGVVAWPEQRTWVVDIDPTSSDFRSHYPEGIETLWDELTDLEIVNTLKIGNTEVFATWDVLESSFEPTDQPLAVSKPISNNRELSVIRFNEVVS